METNLDFISYRQSVAHELINKHEWNIFTLFTGSQNEFIANCFLKRFSIDFTIEACALEIAVTERNLGK